MRRLALVVIPLAAAATLLAAACARSPAASAMRDYSPAPAQPPEPFPVEPGHPEAAHDREAYDRIDDNPFLGVTENPLSTFSVDVDTASYSNVRRFLDANRLPPRDAIRIEELINYFPYDYPSPRSGAFAASVEVGRAPWRPEHLLARIGIKGREVERGARPDANLVFLIDVSGSMEAPNKLPLLKQAMRMLVEQLGERDRVAIAVYAGASGLALPSTPCADRRKILAALDRLEAGGSTNGAEGIQLAYDVAVANLEPGGVNRVILATDGDFNVGTTSQGELTRLIEEKARTGVFLTVLGFGMGNYQDSTLEKLADRGNGSYAYIDTEREARKVLVEQVGSTLVTIAKDVKIQVEFNPALVSSYRLIGYENRMLRAEDFKDDARDAGEIGAGHTVTALYELVPAGRQGEARPVDALRYQGERTPTAAALSRELLTVKIRHKAPAASESAELSFPVFAGAEARPSADFQFASSVAAFGMLLRDSPHKGSATFELVGSLAEQGLGSDRDGHRREFLALARRAAELARR